MGIWTENHSVYELGRLYCLASRGSVSYQLGLFPVSTAFIFAQMYQTSIDEQDSIYSIMTVSTTWFSAHAGVSVGFIRLLLLTLISFELDDPHSPLFQTMVPLMSQHRKAGHKPITQPTPLRLLLLLGVVVIPLFIFSFLILPSLRFFLSSS